MDYSSNKKRANKILYISVVSVLCILAILIAITSANNRKKDDTSKKAETTQSVKQGETTQSSLPQMGTPKQDETTTPSKDNVHNAVAESDKAEDSAKANDAENASAEPEDAEAVGTTPEEEPLPVFTSPVSGAVAKEYTESILVYSLTMNDYRTHTGIDYSAEIGSPVYAAADGTIGEVWEDPMMGTCISVIHTGGAVSIYKNLSKDSSLIEEITAGAIVKAGQVIASVGETAMIEQSDEPHLHYELKVKDQFVNPADYIQVSNEVVYEG